MVFSCSTVGARGREEFSEGFHPSKLFAQEVSAAESAPASARRERMPPHDFRLVSVLAVVVLAVLAVLVLAVLVEDGPR